jgi:hypothetical protein
MYNYEHQMGIWINFFVKAIILNEAEGNLAI